MDESRDERMEAARRCFLDAAGAERDPGKRPRNGHLQEMAAAIQEAVRAIDLLEGRVDGIEHTLGIH